MNQIWNHKNFNMVYKLDISGEFIYDGLQTLNHMDSSSNCAELFSFLYHVSVGIERLQKIIIILFEDMDPEDYESFEESLMTHKHYALHQRIMGKTDMRFNKRENAFLNILSTFYNESRYGRFNLGGSIDHEKILLEEYVRDHILNGNTTKIENQHDIITDPWIKDILGRIVGNISRKYYNILREVSRRKNTFTYETRFCSKAEKIFLPKYRNDSLIDMKITEEIVLKEFLIYLCNTKDDDPFIDYFRQVPPIDIDSTLVNTYLSEIVKGIVPLSLVEEVETIYKENEINYKNRSKMIFPIGNDQVYFDWD